MYKEGFWRDSRWEVRRRGGEGTAGVGGWVGGGGGGGWGEAGYDGMNCQKAKPDTLRPGARADVGTTETITSPG